MTTAEIDAARDHYEREGFYLSPSIIPVDLLERVTKRMDAVRDGKYETGVEPRREHKPGELPDEQLCKIDQSHYSDLTIRELISHPAIGEVAAALTGAKMVQTWATQLLVKPPGGSDLGHVGWHQDWQYWQTWWKEGSNVLTAWVSVTDTTPEHGPMKFIRCSHKWGFTNQGDFWGTDLDSQRKVIRAPNGSRGQEVGAVLPAGAVSFHHRHAFHASSANNAQTPRRSFAIHIRTEDSEPIPGGNADYTERLHEHDIMPIIYQAG
jgi:ectoine hydroxylase-related dioxygenase (phytanoyl-CoA dioxygenase family)